MKFKTHLIGHIPNIDLFHDNWDYCLNDIYENINNLSNEGWDIINGKMWVKGRYVFITAKMRDNNE